MCAWWSDVKDGFSCCSKTFGLGFVVRNIKDKLSYFKSFYKTQLCFVYIGICICHFIQMDVFYECRLVILYLYNFMYHMFFYMLLFLRNILIKILFVGKSTIRYQNF